MKDLNRAKLAIKYIFFELIPVFFLGMAIFLFVLMMFQSFKLSEYIIVQGASVDIVLQILLYMILGFLPILIPIALLFAILLVYGRMSSDSEIVAFKALGLNSWHLLLPALMMGILVTAFSLQVAFQIAPWGQKKLDTLVNRLSQMRPGVTIREGVFSEGFFDLVVYANKIDSADGKLKQVFIYDEREEDAPLTIIASEGQVIKANDESGLRAFLRLRDGNIHKSGSESYTKIDFSVYDINLFDPHEFKEKRASVNSLNMNELKAEFLVENITPKRLITLSLELHRRWALAMASVLFAIIGFSLGTVTNRRTVRSGSMVICIGAVVVYWIFFVGFEAAAQSQRLPPAVASWSTNFIFLIFGLWQLRQVTKK